MMRKTVGLQKTSIVLQAINEDEKLEIMDVNTLAATTSTFDSCYQMNKITQKA